ncbi:FAD-dependent oxidoreductase [Diaphorobacter ruginosibacter]|uniref:NAD(P)/FAD-dependent oxidoreductase n=1 Tax=Diaphorobacter ruginosibacter TaxID=1715720 RepID=UPI0033409044
MTDNVLDFAVIGAGMAGASVAYRLAQKGAAVIVLERESQPGYHSTGRSAAMFMESYGTDQIRALTRASRGFYTHPPQGFCASELLPARDVLYVGQEGQQKLLDDALAMYRNDGLDAEMISAARAKELVPVLELDKIIGAVHDRAATDIDVSELHQGFLRGMRQKGATLRCGAELLAARRDAQTGVWSLTLPGGDVVRARAVVNASGAWADTVAQLCGARPLNIQPKRRTAFTFNPPEGVDAHAWPVVIGVDESFYFKPDAAQLLGSPANADPVAPHDVVAEELDVAMGIHAIESVTSLRIRRPNHVWAGLRSFAPDGDFVIGWDTRCEGFFWLAGQGGYGIQTAAGASATACALLLREELPQSVREHGVDPAGLSPARFD